MKPKLIDWVFSGCEELRAEAERLWKKKQPRVDRLLQHYSEELVALRINVFRHARTDKLEVRMVLQLPTGTLVAEHTADTLQEALDIAVDRLIRELKKHQQLLRRDYVYKRRMERRRNLSAAGSYLEKDVAAQRKDSFFQLLQPLMAGMYDYAKHQVRLMELEGVIARNEVNPRDLVDDTILQAWEEYTKRPQEIDLETWLTRLICERVNKIREQGVPVHLSEKTHEKLDEPLTPETDVDEIDFWLERIFEANEPVELEDLIPDASASEDWDEIDADERRQRIDEALVTLPAEQREVMLLYAVGGYEIEDIAVIMERTQQQVGDLLEAARENLRGKLADLMQPAETAS